jgi:hypothetical protein
MRVLALASIVLTIMPGCQSMKTTAIEKAVVSAAPCPAEFQGEVRIAASAVAWKLPADLAQRDGLNPVLGRRILVSISPRGGAYGMQIASSELAVTPLGGTFRGWAQISGSSRHETAAAQTTGIEVTPGRLRVTPFLRTSKLQPQTLLLDVILAPGAEPLDEMVISVDDFWDASRHSLPPEQINLSLEPLRHFTVYDRVDAIVSSTFTTAPSSAFLGTTKCTAETRVTLIDRESSAPPLWDLRKSAPTGRSEWWLALLSANRVAPGDIQKSRGSRRLCNLVTPDPCTSNRTIPSRRIPPRLLKRRSSDGSSAPFHHGYISGGFRGRSRRPCSRQTW